MRASSEPQCAMARSVISTSIANTVSCRGQTSWKHQRRSQFSSVYYIIKLPQLHLSIPVLHFITCREKHRSSGVHSPVASIRWATSCSDRGKQIKQWTVIWGRHVSKKLAHLEDHCILPQFTLISIYCSSLALSYIYIYKTSSLLSRFNNHEYLLSHLRSPTLVNFSLDLSPFDPFYFFSHFFVCFFFCFPPSSHAPWNASSK